MHLQCIKINIIKQKYRKNCVIPGKNTTGHIREQKTEINDQILSEITKCKLFFSQQPSIVCYENYIGFISTATVIYFLI